MREHSLLPLGHSTLNTLLSLCYSITLLFAALIVFHTVTKFSSFLIPSIGCSLSPPPFSPLSPSLSLLMTDGLFTERVRERVVILTCNFSSCQSSVHWERRVNCRGNRYDVTYNRRHFIVSLIPFNSLSLSVPTLFDLFTLSNDVSLTYLLLLILLHLHYFQLSSEIYPPSPSYSFLSYDIIRITSSLFSHSSLFSSVSLPFPYSLFNLFIRSWEKVQFMSFFDSSIILTWIIPSLQSLSSSSSLHLSFIVNTSVFVNPIRPLIKWALFSTPLSTIRILCSSFVPSYLLFIRSLFIH